MCFAKNECEIKGRVVDLKKVNDMAARHWNTFRMMFFKKIYIVSSPSFLNEVKKYYECIETFWNLMETKCPYNIDHMVYPTSRMKNGLFIDTTILPNIPQSIRIKSIHNHDIIIVKSKTFDCSKCNACHHRNKTRLSDVLFCRICNGVVGCSFCLISAAIFSDDVNQRVFNGRLVLESVDRNLDLSSVPVNLIGLANLTTLIPPSTIAFPPTFRHNVHLKQTEANARKIYPNGFTFTFGQQQIYPVGIKTLNLVDPVKTSAESQINKNSAPVDHSRPEAQSRKRKNTSPSTSIVHGLDILAQAIAISTSFGKRDSVDAKTSTKRYHSLRTDIISCESRLDSTMTSDIF